MPPPAAVERRGAMATSRDDERRGVPLSLRERVRARAGPSGATLPRACAIAQAQQRGRAGRPRSQGGQVQTQISRRGLLRRAALAGGALAGLSLLGCRTTGGSARPAASGQPGGAAAPKRGGTLRVALVSDPGGL